MPKKAAAPKPDEHRCTAACTCRTCGGATWYHNGRHTCRDAKCGESYK